MKSIYKKGAALAAAALMTVAFAGDAAAETSLPPKDRKTL